MEPVYIFGHKNPDTDSVCAAISLAHLKKELGMKALPKVLGHLNNETKFVLDYFKVGEPEYLSDVKIQIKDLKYNKKAMINEKASIDAAVGFMIDNRVTGIPLINEKKNVTGYVNLKDVTRELVRGNIYRLNTSYDNLVKALNGKKILKFDEEVNGEVKAAAYNSVTFIAKVKLSRDDIVIVGDRFKILEHIVNYPIKLIILVGNKKIPTELLKIAKNNKVNIISTPYTTFETSNKVILCNYLQTINENKSPYVVDKLEYVSEFTKKTQRLGFTNYPVINNKNECVGLVELNDLRDYGKKKVILVDHNSALQSVEGLEEAEIVEIIDHHNLGAVNTNVPVSFRCMPVGATCTIIYEMYKENNIKIPKSIQGLMLGAVISDTLGLESATTTELDIKVAKELARKLDLNIKKFALEMFKAGSSLKGKTTEEVLFADYKDFKFEEDKIFLSHVISLDYEEINKNLDSYVDVLNKLTENDYKMAVVMVTDVTKNGSYIVFSDTARDIVSEIYNIRDIKSGTFIPGLSSRKKQLLPSILEVLGRN